MESPLSRSQLCWTIVRVIGLLFLLWGIISFVLSLGAPLFVWVLFGEDRMPSFGGSVAVIFQSVSWLILAFYFLRRGAWIHDLLMFDRVAPRAIPILKKAPIDPKTGLTVEELEVFREWRDGNPTIRYMEIEDQVARYRDYQSESRLS